LSSLTNSSRAQTPNLTCAEFLLGRMSSKRPATSQRLPKKRALDMVQAPGGHDADGQFAQAWHEDVRVPGVLRLQDHSRGSDPQPLNRQFTIQDGDDHGAVLWFHAEWGAGLHEDGFGLLATDEVDPPAGFQAWVARLADESGSGTCWWIVDGDQILGGIALRHPNHELAAQAGHIGYGIRPSSRGQGLATWALGHVVDRARVLGMDRVMVVCEAGNSASAKTIERQGGILEVGRDSEDGAARRYWIRISDE
jgi:RimJ/RimL family protein N-acetyltransferase